MKVLFIGHYREGSGWAKAAIDWILALDAAGVDVVCRPVKLNSENPEIPNRVKELESKDISGCDYCIQNILPHLMDYNGNFKKNVGLFFFETLNMNFTGWPSRLDCMDEVWVPNKEQIDVCKSSGITKPIKVIPCASDISKFYKDYPAYKLPDVINDSFKFYFIGEHIRRKHLSAAMIAYYTSFTKYDNVSFVIKSSKTGYTAQECMSEIEANVKSVKEQLRMYSDVNDYPIHCIITGRITEDELYSLHQQCDCFVMPSFGEGWNIPAFDAMGFSNIVVATDCGGMSDFLSGYGEGYLVPCTVEPIVGYDTVFQEMNTGIDKWKNISINKLGEIMRNVYKYQDKFMMYEDVHKDYVKSFSYENVGKLMKKELENV